MTRLGLLFVGLAVAGLPLAAQEPTPRFEVASIKPNVGPSQFSGANIRRDSFSATYYSVSQLIQLAYGVRDHQILDGPAWIRSERFNVAAKASSEVPRDQALRMVQALLADRFLKDRDHLRPVGRLRSELVEILVRAYVIDYRVADSTP